MIETRRNALDSGSVPVRILIGLGLIAAACSTPRFAQAAAAPAARDSSALERLCDLGVSLALTGREAAAESVFVTLLSRAPRDARALNNLGNLELMRGETVVALAFYGAAADGDSTDAGIVLNQATALMLAGEHDDARARAEEGLRRAGGLEAATRLLGLPHERPSADQAKAADRARVGRDEALELLRAAARSVPADSSAGVRAPSDSSAAGRRRRAPVWRSAGARGSNEPDTTPVVYWKR